MKVLLAVAIGGAIGAVARFQLSQSFIKSFSGDFIYNIMVANIIGCFLMGVCYEFMNLKMNVGLEWRAFFMVGILASFTTFSSFALDVFILVERGNLLNAGIYILSSVIFSIFGLFVGIYIMRSIIT
ncbi:MAG: fluoride efflux transporter CrcB [Rhodospirillaceae bacterium]|nr:fluoride efflux transporter CrcB [Rhodospirillaceae bacterium]|tara:strand:+ start:1043 stop:1423 length:381 start_codon:yes stop_codon:yes gene_type:complete